MKYRNGWVATTCTQNGDDGSPCGKPITVLGDMWGAPIKRDCDEHFDTTHEPQIADADTEEK